MMKTQSTLILTIVFFCFGLALCFGQSVPSSELIKRAKEYDGKSVIFTGEAIGDIMMRKNGAWANIKDGDYAIGVWLPGDLARTVNVTGRYGFIGDEVEITGIFHRTCPEHGGDMDIHALALRKVNPGRKLEEKINPAKKSLAFLLGGILFLLWILTLLRRR